MNVVRIAVSSRLDAGAGADGTPARPRRNPGGPVMLRCREFERLDGCAIQCLPTRSRVSGRRECMATGTVKWFNDAKGYGFIKPDDGEKDLFIHHSEIAGEGYKSLAEGAKVSYEPLQGQKGPEATRVETIG